LYTCFEALFTQIGEVDPNAADDVLKAKIAIRFHCSEPQADIVINGRKRPLQIYYGSSIIKPQLDIELSGDTLHEILLGTLCLSKAIGPFGNNLQQFQF